MRQFRLVPGPRRESVPAITITAPPVVAPAQPTPSGATIYAQPDHQGDLTAFGLLLFSDAALLDAITATTAAITHVKAYASANATAYTCAADSTNCTLLNWAAGHDETGLGACGTNYNVPWGAGRDSTAPPPQGAIIAEGDCSVSFDPTAPLDVTGLPPLAYDSSANTINGVTGAWTLVLSITTDVGDCTFVCGTSFCA